MDLQATKLNVVQKLLNVKKASLLEKINMLLDQEMIVGYSVDGQALTKETYNNRLEEAERQIRAGEFQSQEDLENESENW